MRILFQSFQKVLKGPIKKQKFLRYEGYQKTQNFMLNPNPLKKSKKVKPKKSYKPKTFMNRSKCEKTQFSLTFRLITFFGLPFFYITFSTDLDSA